MHRKNQSQICFFLQIAGENLLTKQETDKELAEFKGQCHPMKVCVSNAGSPVSYQLLSTLASGEIFGKDQDLTINLLGNETQQQLLQGTAMEMTDLAWNTLRSVTVTTDDEEALRDCEAVVLLDQLDRIADEEESVWLRRNADMFVSRMKVIDKVCKQNVKILIAGNGPINTSLYMIHLEAELKNVTVKNIIAMPRLIENQSKAVLAHKVKVKTSDVVDVIVWGDNEKYFCDTNLARVHNHDGPIWGPPSYSRLTNILVRLKKLYQ